jgi:protein-disulfide isomerase
MPVSDGRDHTQGAGAAAVTLLEYGDFECGYCGEAYPVVKELMARLGDRVRLAFRHFPLTQIHPHAWRAAEAAEAAGAQGRFWEMHDMLYERQDALEDDDLLAYANQIGLDVDQFQIELAQGAHAEHVREDFLSGVRSGVNGTPTFFINGRRHDGSFDLKSLTDAVVSAMGPSTGLQGEPYPHPHPHR